MNTERLMAELTRDEGVRFKVYKCPAGKWTIGVGRNLEDRGISPGEAEILLRNDIADVEADLDKHLPWWRNLDDVRQRALANLCFNMGIGNAGPKPKGLLSFKRTLSLLERGDYLEAAQSLLQSKYAKQVGSRALRIAQMIRDGGVS